MSHNTVWCSVATSIWPESQANATVGSNWKQLCLLYLPLFVSSEIVCLDLQRYHSKNFPYLALRDYTGAANGRYHLISSLFIGDDSEMGGAESVFFLNKISKGAAVTRVSLKGLCSIIVNV